MKKTTLSTLLMGTLLMLQCEAATNSSYIGLDVGNTEATMSAVNGTANAEESDNGTSVSLKLGYKYEDNQRVYASAQYIEAEDADFMVYGLGYDYLFGDAIVKPFVGGFIGYGQYQTDRASMIDLDVSGLVFGAQAGLQLEVTEEFELEAGYRYLKSKMQESVGTADIEIDPLSSWFVGFNYNF